MLFYFLISLYTWSSQKFNGYQLLCFKIFIVVPITIHLNYFEGSTFTEYADYFFWYLNIETRSSTSKWVLCMLFTDWNHLFQCYILLLDLLVEIHNNQHLQLKSARKHISWSYHMKQTLSVDLWIWMWVCCWPVSYSASLFLKKYQRVFRVRAKNWIFQVEDLKRNLNDLKPRMGLKLQTYKSIWNHHANMQQCNLALCKYHVLEVQMSKINQLFLHYKNGGCESLCQQVGWTKI